MDSNYLNFNELHQTLVDRVAAARSALRSTAFGRGGVIKIIQDGEKVKFTIPLLGKVYENLIEAVRDSAGLGVTETFSFESGKSYIKAGSQVNAPASIFESIFDKLQNLTTDQKRMLAESNIDVEDLKSLDMRVSIMKSKKGGIAAAIQNIHKQRERGTLDGITIMDDSGARLLEFRANNKILNKYQSNLILSITGHDELDAETFGKILREGDTKKLGDKLGKVGKRLRSILAERPLSLAGDELTKYLTLDEKSPKSFVDSSLVLDPQYEILKIFASDTDDISKVKGLSDPVRAFYKGFDPQNYIGDVVDAARESMGNSTIKELKTAINSFQKRKTGWASNDLESYLKENFGTTKERQNLIDNLFQTIEYADDGSSFLNARYLRKYKSGMQKELKEIRARVDSPLLSKEAREVDSLRAIELENLLSNLRDLDDLQQITGRGNLPGMGGIKTAFEVRNFNKKGLRDYAMIISKFGLKGETGISGDIPQLIFSELGQGSTDVYVDPISAVFHPQIFADEQSISAILNRGRTVLDEFEAAIESDTLPEKVLNQLKMSASRDIEQVPSAMRQSALRNKQFAQSLLDLHRSGISVSSSPQMMNMLHAFYATQAYRENKGFVQAILPETYRFAIDTEKPGFGKNLLGRGFEKLEGITVNDEVINIDKNILKFRVSGHKMLFAGQAAGQFHHALGGYDLDDKGLPRLKTYVDNNGMNRLGFYIFRQPSGPEEILFARANLDSETIQSLFNNTYFNKTLDKMMEADDPSEGLKKLSSVLQGALSDGYDQDQLEQAVYSVYERMEKDEITTIAKISKQEALRIQKYGSSSMQVDPRRLAGSTFKEFTPSFTYSNVYKVLDEPGIFDMKADVLKALESISINQSLKNKINNAGSFKEIMEILGGSGDSVFEKNPQARALLATVFENAAESRGLESGGILGQYINRSMFAGSILNQYEDMFGAIKDENVRKFLKQNYNIGLLGQESAIDASINFSGARKLRDDMLRRLTESSYVNKEGLAKAISKLTRIKGGEVTLDIIGEEIVSNIGKLAGFSKGLDVNDSLKIGIDKFLIESRLKGADIERLARGMLSGMSDAKRMGLGGLALEEEMETVSRLIEKQNETALKDYILNSIGLGPESRYASLDPLNRAGKLLQNYGENIKKMGLRSIGRNEILASAQTSPEAKALAKKILKDNQSDFDRLTEMNREMLREMSDEEKVRRTALADQLGGKIFSQIRSAIQVNNVSPEYMINAIDQLNAGTYRDILSLGALKEADQQMQQMLIQARNLRQIKFYQRFNQEAAELVQSALQDTSSERLTLDSLAAAARKVISQFESPDEIKGTVEEGIYRILAEEQNLIDDDIVKQEARQQVNILRSMIQAQDLQDIRGDLEQVGTALIDDIPQDADNELFDLIKAVNDLEESASVNKAGYKRITEKVNDFKNLFKEDKLIRRGTLAIAALAIGSLAYSEIRDRTVDDITGPPLLPGGNPYEQDYPIRGYQVGDFGSRGYSQGSSYQVSIQGGRDEIERFNEAARGLVNGNISTTIYNNIPNMRRDPYSAMGQSF